MKVTWDQNVCIHAGECVKGLPEVFRIVDGQFVIDSSKASDAAVLDVVAKCPSGALQADANAS